MELQSNTFQEKLDNIEKEFYLLMQQYNKYYVLANTTKNANNKNFLLNTQNNIDALMVKYSNLENTLSSTIKRFKNEFKEDDEVIKNLKTKFKKINVLNKKLKQTQGASKNFKNQINTYRKDNKVNMLYHFVGVLGISYLIYSSIRN